MIHVPWLIRALRFDHISDGVWDGLFTDTLEQWAFQQQLAKRDSIVQIPGFATVEESCDFSRHDFSPIPP